MHDECAEIAKDAYLGYDTYHSYDEKVDELILAAKAKREIDNL